MISPDGASYLTEFGTFAPYTGTEATAPHAVGSLAREERRQSQLTVARTVFSAESLHRVEAWLAVACSPERLAAFGTFMVGSDTDLDGLSDMREAAIASDPDDADTDDDGLSDGLDGDGDADLDGAPDALDCDSDGDGLTDGLESGVETPPAATDVTAGCLVADADPLTTTAPDLPDTDGGGLAAARIATGTASAAKRSPIRAIPQMILPAAPRRPQPP